MITGGLSQSVRSRCHLAVHRPQILPHNRRRKATPVACHGAAMGQNRMVSGRRRDHPGRDSPAGPPVRTGAGGRASRHGQLPGRRARTAGAPPDRRCRAPTGICRRSIASRAPEPQRAASPRGPGSGRTDHRHPRRGDAQPRNGFQDVLDWCSGPPPPTAPTSPG